jgi:hypothetical protein
MKASGLFILVFSIIQLGCATTKDNTGKLVKLNLYFEDQDHVKPDKALLILQIINKSKTIIKVPDLLYWGLPKDPIADFILEMEKKGFENTFTAIEIPDEFHHTIVEPYLTELKRNEIRRDTTDLAFYFKYKLPKGEYRVRVLYKISRYNNEINDFYSKWNKFNVK